MSGRGWAYKFKPRPWAELATKYSDLIEQDASYSYMLDIVESVLGTPAEARLAAQTSMHDLLVADTPVADPPLEVVVVRAPGSVHPPKDGHVLIEHVSLTGHDDQVERPAEDGVRLFWRFMEGKFGVSTRI